MIPISAFLPLISYAPLIFQMTNSYTTHAHTLSYCVPAAVMMN